MSRSSATSAPFPGEAGGEDEEFGGLGRGGHERVGARFDAGDRIDPELVGPEQQAQLAGRVAAGPEVDGGDLTRLGADVGPLVGHTGRRVERRLLVVADREIAVERTERQAAAVAQGPCHAGDHQAVVAVGGHQSERALAQAHDGVELVLERQVAGVESFEGRAGRPPPRPPGRRIVG